MTTAAELQIKVESRGVKAATKANKELAKSGKEVADETTRSAKATKAKSDAESKAADSTRRASESAKNAAKAQREQARTAAKLRKEYSGLKSTLGGVIATFISFQAAASGLTILREFSEASAVVTALGRASEGTAKDFSFLTEQARELGKTTRFTATQVSQAQAALIRGGLSTREAFESTSATLDLATAGLLSLDRAAEITAITLNQFGLQASQAGRVADVLVLASSTSATNVEQLAQAMKFAAPVAAGFGATFEETAAAMQVLANSGLQASIAGTNLRGIYSALASPTKRARNEIAKLARASGKQVEEFDILENSLEDVFKSFNEAGAGAKEFLKIFNRPQAPGALAFGKAAADIGKFQKANEEAEGTARDFAKVLEQELNGKILNLISAVQETVIAFGTQFGPELIAIVEFLTQMVRALTATGDQLKALAPAAVAAAKSIKFMAGFASVFVAARLGAAIFAATKALAAFAIGLKVVRGALVSTGLGIAIVALGTALNAFGAFEGIEIKGQDELNKILKERADADKAAEVQGRRRAAFMRAINERELKAAQEEIDKEKELAAIEEQRQKDAEAAAKRRRERLAGVQAELDAILPNLRAEIEIAGTDDLGVDQLKEQQKIFGLISERLELDLPTHNIDAFFEALQKVTTDDTFFELSNEIQVFLDKVGDARDEIGELEELKELGRAASVGVLALGDAAAEARREMDILMAEPEDRGNLRIAEEMRESLEAIRVEAERTLAEGTSSVEEFFAKLREADRNLEVIQRLRPLQAIIEQGNEAAEELERVGMAADFTAERAVEFGNLADTAIAGYRAQMEIAGADTEALEGKILGVLRAVDKFNKQTARAEGIAAISDSVQILTRSFLDLFEALITGSDNAREALASFIQSVTQALFQKFVVEQILGAVSKGFAGIGGGGGVSAVPSADGNAFRGGSIVPFAKGGIIGGPTVFPLGLAGEAGPEAIMPLQRGPDGKLGVSVNGGSRAGTNPFVLRSVSPGASTAMTEREAARGGSRTTNVQMNIQTPDVSSFRRSNRQLTDSVLDSVRV